MCDKVYSLIKLNSIKDFLKFEIIMLTIAL